jgi:non-specific serine/threonine protein kinase
MRQDLTAAAWPLLEESLRTFRQLDLPRGEAQVFGFLAKKARGEGDLALAIELRLESAAVAHEIGWAWWESRQLHGAAALERRLGKLDAAEGHALRSLELSSALGDRRDTILAAAELAVVAAERGDAQRAGRLWEAIENEQSSRHSPPSSPRSP